MIMTLFLSAGIFIFVHAALTQLWAFSIPLYLIVSSICVFYGLANRQLITEGKKVFATLQKRRYSGGAQPSVPDRRQGYHQSQQSADRIAVMETMSENLGDGVIAPLFGMPLLGARHADL